MTRLSGSRHVPYQLRPNKAIDRLLLIDTLRLLAQYHGSPPEAYVGLGGPFLEDFRLLAHEFPSMRLVCVERDGETHKRQLFHRCSSKLECVKMSFAEYLPEQLPTEYPIALWADYTKLERSCLSELADIVRRVVPSSLVRVTVPTETPIYDELELGRFTSAPPPDKAAEFGEFRERFYREHEVDGVAFAREWSDWHAFSRRRFPLLVSRMVGAVCQHACNAPKAFLPVHNLLYSDGTRMLSKTGIILMEDDIKPFTEFFSEHFEYAAFDDETIETIDVPVLTTKERLTLDHVLPTEDMTGETCLERLGYLIEGDGSRSESLERMMHYEKYYRYYPHFGKIVP